MSHKLLTLAVLCACFLGMNATLWGQNAAAAHGILGYLDPQTGVFHTLPGPATQDAEPPATSVFAGKFVVNFTITVSSTLATSVKIACGVTASLQDTATLNFITENAMVVATRAGSTATCTVTIPYSWTLGSATTDRVMLSYQISAPVEATATTILPSRTSLQSIGTIAVPANGATTTETVTATI